VGAPAANSRRGVRGRRLLLERLGAIRNRYGAGLAGEKLALLEGLAGTRCSRATQLLALSGHLLYLRAFPDDAAVYEAAGRGIAELGRRVRLLSAAERARLEDTGLPGTASRHTFEAAIARWLVDRFDADVEIDWPSTGDASALAFLLELVVRRAEQDGLDSEALSTRGWLRRIKVAARETDLHWLLRELAAPGPTRALWRALYDRAAVPVVWRIRDGAGAITRNALSAVPRRFRGNGLRRLPAEPKRLIATPLPGIRLLGARRAAEVIDVARAALTARCREVYALSHANLEEVHLADLGEGTALALIGVLPEKRLSLESNYSYLLLANGVPVGYAGVTPLYRQANTGINIFEPFRGSEAAYLCAQTLRAFQTIFGVDRFLLNPYQIGAGNPEAIASGAFWFYYRLGFRPVAPELASVAAAEFDRQQSRRGHRSDAATLRRLAQSDVELTLPGARPGRRFDETWLAELSLLASTALANAAAHGRGRGEAVLAERVAGALGIGRLSRWPAAEREALAALAPLFSLLDLRSLGPSGRERLVRLARLKGGAQEAPYVRAVAADPVFAPALIAIARRTVRRRRADMAT
jgi:hypothetical protein